MGSCTIGCALWIISWRGNMRATVVLLLIAGCKGDPGADGQSIATNNEPPGANCVNGGLKVTSSSGINYVCNGSSSGVTTSAEAPGSNCAAGGVRITSSSGSNYVCNGARGGT